MGREIRRVPLDFTWPFNKRWEGFLLPEGLHEAPCPDCTRGMTPAGEWLQALVHQIDMLGSDIGDQQRGRPLHPWLAQNGNAPTDASWQVLRPSEDILDVLSGLTERPRADLVHPLRGGGDGYRIVRKIVAAAGLDPEKWGDCPTCGAHGSLEVYPGQRAEAEAWEATDPPEGEGWQLWETVSEGSPISPVFATPEELAHWMASPAYTWGASKHSTLPYESALAFIREGWAPSFVASPKTGVVSGVEWIGSQGD